MGRNMDASSEPYKISYLSLNIANEWGDEVTISNPLDGPITVCGRPCMTDDIDAGKLANLIDLLIAAQALIEPMEQLGKCVPEHLLTGDQRATPPEDVSDVFVAADVIDKLADMTGVDLDAPKSHRCVMGTEIDPTDDKYHLELSNCCGASVVLLSNDQGGVVGFTCDDCGKACDALTVGPIVKGGE